MLLHSLYQALINCVEECLVEFSTYFSSLGMKTIEQKLKKQLSLVYSNEILYPKTDISLNAYNAFGKNLMNNLPNQKYLLENFPLATLKIKISNIKSPKNSSIDIGAVSFGESFFIQESKILNLTEQIEKYLYFNLCVSIPRKIMTVDLLGNLEKEFLKEGRIAFINCNTNSSIQSKCHLSIFELGIIFYSGNLKSWIIPFDWISGCSYLNIDRPILLIELSKNISLLENFKPNIIALELTGGLHEIYTRLSSVLKEKGKGIVSIENAPQYLESSYSLGMKPQIEERLGLTDSDYFEFLAMKQGIPEKIQSLTLCTYFNTKGKPERKNMPVKAGVILVNGGFQSGKKRFAEKLLVYAKENGETAMAYLPDFQDLPSTNEKAILTKISEILKNNEISLLICSIPSACNSGIIAQELLNHKVFVRCVVTKICLNSLWSNNNCQPLPFTFIYPKDGFSNFLILDSFNMNEKEIDKTEKCLNNIFPFIKKFRVNANILTHGVANEILRHFDYISDFNKLLRMKNSEIYSLFSLK